MCILLCPYNGLKQLLKEIYCLFVCLIWSLGTLAHLDMPTQGVETIAEGVCSMIYATARLILKHMLALSDCVCRRNLMFIYFDLLEKS